MFGRKSAAPRAESGAGHGTGGRQPGYDAFLSYSHAADGELTPTLQCGLQRLAKPWYRMRALRVFRDQTNLAANPDLWTTIESALHRSRFFVLLASPEAAASPWVGREIEYWQAHRERETFLVVLTEGTIAWDHAAGDFDWSRTTALPRQLAGWFRAEPLWVDLRWARDESQVSLRHTRFRDAVATLAASIHGMAKDELDSEDVRTHRQANRLRWAAVTGLAALTAISGVLGFLADRNADRAQAALRREVAKTLATQSQILGDRQPGVSKLLSVAAWRLDPTADSRRAMVSAVDRPGVAVLADQTRPAFSRDGTTLVTSNHRDELSAWDTRTHTRRREPVADVVSHVPFGGNIRVFADKEPRYTLSLHDVVTHAVVGRPLVGHTANITAVKFRPDGRVLATASYDRTVRFWDAATGAPVGRPLTGHTGGVNSVAWSPDGKVVATGSVDEHTVRLWDAATGAPIGRPLPGATDALTFSPDGRTLATANLDARVQLWNAVSQEPLGGPIAGHTDFLTSADFSPDGKILATGSRDHTVRLWSTATHRPIGDPLTGHIGDVSSVTFGPDSHTLASDSFQDDTVRLWDITNQVQAAEPRTAKIPGGISATAFSRDGHILAGVGGDGVWLWDATTGDPMGDPIGGARKPLALSPDGRTLATGGDDYTVVRLWDTATHRQTGEFRTGQDNVSSVSFSPDGRTLATANGDRTVRLWDVTTRWQLGGPLLGHEGGVNAVAWSPDGRTLATGAVDNTARLWDAATHAQLGEPLPVTGYAVDSVAFSPDGRTLATGGDDHAVRLWDSTTHARLGEPLTAHAQAVDTVAFSPDGQTLASGSYADGVRLWDVVTRTQRGQYPDPDDHADTVAFSPDGHTMATGDEDGARLWQVPSTAAVDATLCARMGGSLTPQEWAKYVPPEIPYQPVCP